jgi:hypothetical protein
MERVVFLEIDLPHCNRGMTLCARFFERDVLEEFQNYMAKRWPDVETRLVDPKSNEQGNKDG